MEAEIPQEKFAIFLDISGSVGGSINYWTTVNEILTRYAKDISHFYSWESEVNKSSIKDF